MFWRNYSEITEEAAVPQRRNTPEIIHLKVHYATFLRTVNKKTVITLLHCTVVIVIVIIIIIKLILILKTEFLMQEIVVCRS